MPMKILDDPEAEPSLLMTSRVTAQRMSISQRKLFDLTYPRGTLRAVKLPGKVLYARSEVDRWILEQQGSQNDESGSGREPETAQ